MEHPIELTTQNQPVSSRHDRYADNWREHFAFLYRGFMQDNMTILDVGSGRSPAVSIDQRPSNCNYIGLDISAAELALASTGSYDSIIVTDLKSYDPQLDCSVDLAISWQVLEHIQPLSSAVRNVHSYLKPGGHFVAMLSGSNAHFALINRIVPQKLGTLAMERFLHRPPDTVFRAHYDNCTYSGLSQMFDDWQTVEIRAAYRGADYFRFFTPLQRLYLVYEDWIAKHRKLNLATHYVVIAEK